MRIRLLRTIFIGLTFTFSVHATEKSDVAFITMVAGEVVVDGPGAKRNAIALTKLSAGECLLLKRDSHLRIVYFDGGRQESWKGEAKLTVGSQESVNLAGSAPKVTTLPAVFLKPLWSTPGGGPNDRIGAVRVRGSNSKIAAVEKNYADLRENTIDDDRTPELYLLAALFTLEKFERIESVLNDLSRRFPGSSDVAVIREHYHKAIEQEQAREASKATKAPL